MYSVEVNGVRSAKLHGAYADALTDIDSLTDREQLNARIIYVGPKEKELKQSRNKKQLDPEWKWSELYGSHVYTFHRRPGKTETLLVSGCDRPKCPHCSCAITYYCPRGNSQRWRCKACQKSFTCGFRGLNLSGKRFGMLTVISFTGKSAPRQRTRLWLSRCDCGNEIVVRASSLLNGDTTSCGCRRQAASLRRAMAQRRDALGHFQAAKD